MRRRIFPRSAIALAFGSLPLIAGQAQSPAPVIIQAATSAPLPAAAIPAIEQPDSKALLQLLQEMQATNAATIKKQEATLQSLDELQKAAEEIKIFSKRG